MSAERTTEWVRLLRGDVDDLARTLTLLEDWLLHASCDTLADLREFSPHHQPRDPVAMMIDTLADHTRQLHYALERQ